MKTTAPAPVVRRLLQRCLPLLAGLLLAIAAIPASAEEIVSPPRESDVRALTILAEDVARLKESQRLVLTELGLQLAAATDETRTSALREEIARVKSEGEIGLLGCQIRCARALGREDLAAEFEKDLHRLEDPAALHSPRNPVARIPAPGEDGATQGGAR